MKKILRVLAACALLHAAVPTSAAEGPNSLLGVVTEAPADSSFKNETVTFTGLTSNQATVVWPDGGDSKMTRIFDNGSLVVLQMVSTAGSTDTVYLDKLNKRFTVVSVGALRLPVDKASVGVSLYRGFLK